MEIIEAVAILRLSLGLLLPGNGFLKLAFFVCGIQKPDILQRMYVFLFPAGEDLIRNWNWAVRWKGQYGCRLPGSAPDQNRRSCARYQCK